LASAQFTEPSCGAIIACIWLINADRSGMPPAPPVMPGKPAPAAPPAPNALKICSNGVPLKGFGVSSSGRSPGSFVIGPNYSPRPMGLRRCEYSRLVTDGPGDLPVVRLVDLRETPLDVAEVLEAIADPA